MRFRAVLWMLDFSHPQFLQICHVKIVFEGDERVGLTLGNMTMEADRELTKYYIEESSPSLIQISQREIQMEIVFKRLLLTETVRTFFPSLLLVCFSYATSFFRSTYLSFSLLSCVFFQRFCFNNCSSDPSDSLRKHALFCGIPHRFHMSSTAGSRLRLSVEHTLNVGQNA